MQCDMCGKKTDVLYETLIEGVEMNVCKECSKFGKVKRTITSIQKQKKAKKTQNKTSTKKDDNKLIEEYEEVIVDDYPNIIKKAREKKKLKQEELAKKIAERESLIHKIESGHFVPSIKVAKKLEKILNIHLIDKVKVETYEVASSQNKEMTIGDMIKIKKKKK